MEAWHQQVVDVLRQASSVEYLVKHSVLGARAPTPESTPGPLPRMHYQGELIVARSGIRYSVDSPHDFRTALHALSLGLPETGADEFQLPIGSAKVAFLDARDIATLAAHLLSHADPQAYHERVFELTGPEADHRRADLGGSVGCAAGREIRYVDPPEDQFLERIKSSGIDDFSAERLSGAYHDCKEGWLGMHIAEDFSQELGRPPTSFAKFALDHAEHFAARP